MVQNGDSGAKSSRDDGKKSAEPDEPDETATLNKSSPVTGDEIPKKLSSKKVSPVADTKEVKEQDQVASSPGASKTSSSTVATAATVDDVNDCESDDCESGGLNANNDDASDQSHNDPGKMFIGGLSWQTSAEGLRDYFCKFGDVNECMVMRDPATKRARGFGFITFADPASVEKVLAEESHLLDGKKIDPKVAFPKQQQPKMVVKTKKVFIGGLSATSTLDDMKHYFQQYGKIEDAMLMFDKTTQRHRGFGFITFDDDDISDKVCEIHFHEINGKMVECKKAQPKEVMLPVQMNKSRAAAARNYYGIAPEQLLAYASYMPNMPRLGPYNNPGVLFPTTLFNGFPQSFGLSGTSSRNTSGSHHGLLNGGGGNNAGGPALGGSAAGLINPRNLAAVQLAAQQQAVYEAAMAYASSLGSLGSSASASGGAASSGGGAASSSGDGSAGPLHLTGQPSHNQQRQPVHPTQVVVTTHHHLQHAHARPHHIHSAVSQQSHLHHHAQQQQAGGSLPPLHHHQHTISGVGQMQHIRHQHGQHPQIQPQSQQQRPPLLPAHFPPHKI